ncbi:MAG: response regulator [Pirellulales bacterium]|nr:response regulator [Pirellulales bacterium]
MKPKILFVDDEANILSALAREFHKRFDVQIALSVVEGLNALEQSGPFAVVVSDLQMPKMTGIQFLGEVKKRAPETVRIMLTGQASEQLAVDAVDEGHIFRFHTKPCAFPDLLESIEEGVEEYQRQVWQSSKKAAI